MKKSPVVLIAFEEFDNLGTGYLVSFLSDDGFDSLVIDVRIEKEEILRNLLNVNPFIVGFSVVFEFYIYAFANLISYLRKQGVVCHFTAGGQYASLRYKELFEIIPELDSTVRFEGEYTFLELVKSVYSGNDLKNLKSIVYKNEGNLVATPLRPLEDNLDNFPFPKRSPLKEYAFNKKFATILAGRGCIYNCVYCNTKKFFQLPQGPVKRLREPEMVVREMELLYHEKQCSIFLFQDDDFPVKTRNGNEWINRFCSEIKQKKLVNKIMWKINCRPDEINHDSFALMKDYGLFLVFIGIEDGTDSGLKLLNKRMTVAKSLKGINALKKLGLGFDFGFMLFQPDSTFDSVLENLGFLKKICSDGYSPVTFLKMLPFFETEAENKLRKEGRLTGKPGFLDYSFLDENLNLYYEFFEESFLDWTRGNEGLLNISRWARNHISIFSFYYEAPPYLSLISKNIKNVVSKSNLFFLDTMLELATIFKSVKYDSVRHKTLIGYSETIKNKHDQFREQISDLIDNIYRLAEYQIYLQPENN
jgi:anaerobic magnesium-protoporphyrin IX monomethyl ester cyclase